MAKKILLVSSIIILCAATFYLLKSNLDMRKALTAKDEETKKLIENERLKVREDLKQKYSADMVSYKAMMKKLEMEKIKAQEIKKELDRLTNEDGG